MSSRCEGSLTWRWALGARWSSSGLLGSVGVGDVVVGHGWTASGLVSSGLEGGKDGGGLTTFMRDGR
jgi:hypothetical protein